MEKAQNSITAPTSRRNFIKSGAAVIAALTVPAIAHTAPNLPMAVAKKSGAAVPSLTGEFAAKRQTFRDLKIALNNLYEANDIKLERLVHPELPAALLKPLEIPGNGKKAPDENGWSSSELERLASSGKWEVFVKEDKKNRSITIRSGFRSVHQATKKRAAELLPVRVAYDAAVKKRMSKVNRIENSTRGPMKKMDNALLEAMEHRVTHVGELFQKVQLVKEADLFPDHSYPEDREDHTVKCLFRDIEKLTLQA